MRDNGDPQGRRGRDLDDDGAAGGADADALPVDLPTLGWRVARRWPVLVRALGVAAAVGVIAALLFGARVYEAETVLLHKADKHSWASLEQPPTLGTLGAMVKVPSNLEVVRQRLGLSTPLGRLGSRFDVRVHENTTLMSIKATADSPELAADMANTLREVFLETQRDLRHQEAGRQIAALETRIAQLTQQLTDAEASLTAFNREHGLVDLEKESAWSLDELMEVELQHQAAEAEAKALTLQISNLEKSIEAQQARVESERKSPGAAAGGAQLNARIEQLRHTLETARDRQVDQASLANSEVALQRAEALRAKGLISDAAYDQAQAEYRRAQARTDESSRTRSLRRELESLEGMAASGIQATGAAAILQGMQLRSFELQLDQVAASERMAFLDAQRAELRKRLDEVPDLQRTALDLEHTITTTQTERDALLGRLDLARQVFGSDAPDFVVAALAVEPDHPLSSNRRLILAAVLALSLGLTLVVVVALELLDDTVISEGEAVAKLRLPVLGVLPWVPGAPYPCPVGDDDVLLERFMLIAASLQHRLAGGGKRILITAAGPGEGTSLVTNGLAASLGRMGERVLVIDGHVRDPQADPLIDLIGEPQTPLELVRGTVERILAEQRSWAQGAWGGLVSEIRRRIPVNAPASISRLMPGAGATHRLTSLFERAWGGPSEAGAVGGTSGSWWSAPGRPAHRSAGLSVSRLLIADWDRGAAGGLSEFLSQEVGEVQDVLWPTRLPGVDCLPRLDAAPSADLLGSTRMTALMTHLERRYSLILVDAPPAQPYVDAELIARQCDAVVLVVGSGDSRIPALRRAVRRLEAAGAPVVGVVLNGVERPFLKDL